MTNIIKKLYRSTVSHLRILTWRKRTPRDDALVSRLGMYELSLASFNSHLDEKGFPEDMRFPEVLEYPLVYEVIHTSIEQAKRDSSYDGKDLYTKSNMLREHIAKAVAEHLGTSISVERKVFEDNGFWKEG